MYTLFKFLLFIIPLWGAQAQTTPTVAPEDKTKQTIVEALSHFKDPKSCEAQYYYLFLSAEGKEKKYFYGDGKVLNLSKLKFSESLAALTSLGLIEPVDIKDLFISAKSLFLAHLGTSTAGDILSPEIKACTFKIISGEDENEDNFLGTFLAPGTEENKISTLYWTSSRLHAVQSRAANVFFLGHELSHIGNWSPALTRRCLSSPFSIGARLGIFFSWPDILRPKKEESHGGFAQGEGTARISELMRLLETNDLSAARLNELLTTLRFSEMNLPSQMSEAIADFWATEVVADFIATNYPTPFSQKKAAQAVLFQLPPHLFIGSAAKLMNTLGSKQTNERRVTRIILAHPKMQRFLDCKPEKESELLYCGSKF
jgi:hypothetical protein